MSRYAGLFNSPSQQKSAALKRDSSKETETFTLLFVDDEPAVLKSLRRIFLEENYQILTAENARDALRLLQEEKIHLVISDHRMPGMTGAELLKEIKNKWPETLRIMLTGHADIHSIMGAVNEGAVYKFITKPWNDEDLRLTVSLALQQYILVQENKRLKDLTKRQELKIKKYADRLDQHQGILGSILQKERIIAKEDLIRANRQLQADELLGDALVRLKITTEAKIVKALQKHLNMEYLDLKELEISPTIAKFLPKDLCERNRVLPVELGSKHLTLAMADPSDIFKADSISFMTGLQIIPRIATTSDILAQLQKIYGEKKEAIDGDILCDIEPLDEIDIILEEEEQTDLQELVGSSQVPPIVRIVNAIISEAVRYKASDIHLEPKTKYSVVRFRIDGMLHSKIKLPSDLHPATVSRLKILARMDISERRVPQDGRISVKAGTQIVDIRVATMPTINGEKVVMRILDKSGSIKRLEELGVLSDDMAKVEVLIKKPQGIVISTGPTGSGKTTLLYSILNAMLEDSKNFQTIEDPVEYFLDGANQVYVRDKIGLSFASILRATLRQDPDVLLVGEVRDLETADVAFKAALTGHMVLSTLHTNNSVASITRLMDLGVKPFMIASAVEGIVAQRLVRRVCRYCSESVPADEKLLELLNIKKDSLRQVKKGRGCKRCSETGYLGRTGIYEIFLMNDDFRQFVSSSKYREPQLVEMARAGGMRTLIEDGTEKVGRGITTLEELLRVLGPQTRLERKCDKCGHSFDMKFLFCPYCGTVKRNFCRTCKIPLEPEWRICPACGKRKEDDNG